MARFQFSLQRLLDLRTAAERVQAAAIGQATQEEERRRVESERQDSHLAEVENQVTGNRAVPAGLMQALGMTTEAARAQVNAAREALQQATDSLQHEQELFTDARSARKSLERLRDRKAEDWNSAEGRKEQEDSDEIARQRPARDGS